MPRGWIVLIVVTLGVVVFIALLVLLLVSGTNFDTPGSQVPITHGNCAPFCGTTAPIPNPQP
ncbi:hypothetical protein EBN03_01345 [Nocardia stercoris]|uniref:Uncharacterized protein n=2 Tax=Nocardia stercoris TaxID=2483361 RepID=A0A3M2LI86_9NOCA|nr:hypothetical protein EBN03_01345 [Nocardia stercoris]